MALLLIRLYPASLLMVSIYGLADNAVRVTFGSTVGRFVAKWVRKCWHCVNVCVCLCIACSSTPSAPPQPHIPLDQPVPGTHLSDTLE